jgi:UDP-glucose 4-epimerase/UDP-arabinose 4-epimerase
MRRILVTGGAGYIGSHTAKALAEAGHVPIVFDDLSNGHAEAVQWGPLVLGDVRDLSALEACMRAHAVEAVVHFAGLIEVGRSALEPDRYWSVNLGGTAAVLNAMRACGVRRLVFSSTAAVYGQPASGGLLDEDMPTLPINVYGEGKLAAERMIAANARAYGLQAVALRYFNACGADPEGELGEAHGPETHLIPLAIEAALGLGPPLTVFGDDFPTPDRSCVRDYVHVRDLATAHVLALGADTGREGFAAMNLGTGRGASVREILAAVERVTGQAVPHRVGGRRFGDPAALVADPARAMERLGWRPRFSDLEQIVGSAVAWRRSPRFGLVPPLAQAVA